MQPSDRCCVRALPHPARARVWEYQRAARVTSCAVQGRPKTLPDSAGRSGSWLGGEQADKVSTVVVLTREIALSGSCVRLRHGIRLSGPGSWCGKPTPASGIEQTSRM